MRIQRFSMHLFLFATAMAFSASGALAHTTVKAQATEGVRDDNALRVGHGCGADGGVIAQSVVFPGENPVLTSSDPSYVVQDLSEVIAQGTLAGLARGIQDRSIFTRGGPKLDPNGNHVGFFGAAGYLHPLMLGRVPFQFTPPSFVAGSCVTRLLVKVAVADICSVKPPVLDPNKVNLWIPDNGSVLATEGAHAGVEGIGEAATLTVNRDLVKNPLDPSACAAGVTLTVEPSAQQLDRDLPIPGYWPKR